MIRLAAIILDLLLGFFVAFGLATLVGGSVRIAVAIVFLAGWLYRWKFGATPGQQIMGLRRARPRGLLAFVVAAFVIAYVGFTLAGGVMIRTLTDEKIDARVAGIESGPWTPPERTPIGVEQWNSAAFEVPLRHGEYDAEFMNCCVMYGPYHSEAIDPGLMIVARSDLHPFDYCKGATGRAVQYLSGCTEGPLAFQRAVIGASRGKRDIALTPLGVVRRNFELIAKSIYFEDADPTQRFRTFKSGDADVVWIVGTVTLKKDAVSLPAKFDRFLIANANEFAAIDLVWKKIPRDEQLAAQIVSTLSLRPPQTRGDTIAHLYNAYRMSGRRQAELERVIAAVEKSGTARERDSLALHVKTRSAR